MASEKYMRLDPAYRKLQKLRDLVREQNVPSKIRDEIDEVLGLMKSRTDYCEGISTHPSKDLQQLMHSTLNHQWQTAVDQGKLTEIPSTLMMSGNLEVQFLRSLASLGNVKRILELGMFTGCTALAFAESIPADGQVVTCELDPYIADTARSFLDKSACGKKVEIMKGPAKSSMEVLAQKKQQFDLIFLDADKSNYTTYYKMIWDLGLLAPNGTIVVDNVLFFGDPYTKEGFMGKLGEGVTKFNEMVKQDESVHKMIWDLGLLAPNGTIVVDNVLFFGDPYTKEGFMGERGEGVTKFNEMVRQDGSVHKIMVPIRDGMFIIRRKTDVDGRK